MRKFFYLGLYSALIPAFAAVDSTRLLYRIDTVAGSANLGDDGPATNAQIGPIQGIAIDRHGNLYLSDTDHQRVRKIDSNGIITTIAGTGVAGFSGDGGPATSAQLNLPYGLAVDANGYLYITDLANSRIRRVSPGGAITTYAGSGGQGSSGDGGPAISAQLLEPRNVAVDSAGNLYISEFGAHRVRKVTPDGQISTVAGTGVAGFRGDGGPATAAQLAFPAGVAVDRLGNLYIADTQNDRIRKLLPGGQISTALGGGSVISLSTPLAVAVDLAGDLLVADETCEVHEYTAAGVFIDYAGTNENGFSGDGGPASRAQLVQPLDLALDLNGNLYIADETRVRQVDTRDVIHTLAGADYLYAIGDGGSATAAELNQPSGVALDAVGNLYIADPGTERIRRVDPAGTIATAAGSGPQLPGPDAAVATATTLMNPMGTAVDPFGNIVVVETGAHRIREVTADGRIWTIMGTGTAGLGPELLPPTQTQLRAPRGVCLDRYGDLYVADTGNHRVLLSPSSGLVSTAAGNGAAGSAGDGGLARLAQLDQPSACALDSAGNLYIADTYNHSIRKVSIGVITTVAGTGLAGDSGDEEPATSATLYAPRGVAVDDNGNIFIADTGNNRIRQVTPDGVIHTIAGGSGAGFAGDAGPAVAALLDSPGGILLDGAGDLYFADINNNRVRRLTPDGLAPQAPAVPPPPPLSIGNAASLASGAVAPGEIVTIFGSGLGPESGVVAIYDSAGLLANVLAGSEVRFDGVPAALFYAQASQLNVQAPYSIAGNTATHIEVFYQGQSTGTLDVAVAAAAPGIFVPAVNQDGSFNSPSNPAPRGTILALYATGEGLTNGSNISGQPAAAPYPQPDMPVTATVGGASAQIVWAGSAPGLVGVLQVNLRVPDAYIPSGAAPLALSVGAAVSPSVTIWLQ